MVRIGDDQEGSRAEQVVAGGRDGEGKAKDLGEGSRRCGPAAERDERRRGRLPDGFTDDQSDGELPTDQPLALAITDSLDLHSFQPGEIHELIADYLEAAIEAGLLELLIIHGRGAGVQRQAVRALLAADSRVQAFGDVPERAGGATWLRLRAR